MRMLLDIKIPLANSAVERSAGSHSLAAAAQRLAH
jgi:hypothetical protein